jgi:hypothetical protein
MPLQTTNIVSPKVAGRINIAPKAERRACDLQDHLCRGTILVTTVNTPFSSHKTPVPVTVR